MKNEALNILYEDNSILVCVKPAGVATESANMRTPDMVSMAKSYLKPAKYLGVVHRLDQPVSGILVMAKTQAAAASLSKQLQGDDMGKYYTATVEGEITDSDPTLITNYLIKDSKVGKALIVSENQKGPDGKPAREAKLTFEIKSYNPENDTTELLVKLLTGRFHQIRAQLSNMGHPILGDVKYGAMTDRYPKGQIALCASELHFKHPKTMKDMKFTI